MASFVENNPQEQPDTDNSIEADKENSEIQPFTRDESVSSVTLNLLVCIAMHTSTSMLA